jgi:ribonuclease P protein component
VESPRPAGEAGRTGSTSAGAGLPRASRVRRSPEYLRAYRRGRRRTGTFVILHFVPNEVGMFRVGVTVSRKVGNSVVRHRVKRRLLEAFRRAPGRDTLPPYDLVLHVRPEAAAASYAALRQDLEGLLAALPGARR